MTDTRYADGFRNGRRDAVLGIKLVVSWLDQTSYGVGYRAGLSAALSENR